MGSREDNALREAVVLIKHVWLHRRGNEIPAAIQDTISAVYKDGLRPLLIKKEKKEHGWFFVINLPPGVGYRKFKDQEELFRDAIGGAVHIEKRGKAVFMEVMTEELKSKYLFKKWDGTKYPDMYLPIPIGYSPKGLIVIDLSKVPHLFVAGETNYGKSNFLHVVANSLLLYSDAYVVIIDLKKAEFAYLKDRALVIKDVPTTLMVLQLLNKELDKRLDLFEHERVNKIQKLLKRGHQLQFITLIVDELAEMQDEECQRFLERLARLGRAVGIHIVPATQRPSSTLYKSFGDIKALFPARVCFLVADAINSNMILDSDRASLIPAIPGRAIYKWGLEMLEVQTLLLDPEEEGPELLCKMPPKKVISDVKFLEEPKRLPPR